MLGWERWAQVILGSPLHALSTSTASQSTRREGIGKKLLRRTASRYDCWPPRCIRSGEATRDCQDSLASFSWASIVELSLESLFQHIMRVRA